MAGKQVFDAIPPHPPLNLPPREKVLWLAHAYGHHHVSDDPDIGAVDLLKLDEHHPVVVETLMSYQSWFKPELDAMIPKYYPERKEKIAYADGKFGPATYELSLQKRCARADVPHPGEAQQQANWPDRCRTSLTYGRTFERLPGLTRKQTDQVWWGICNNWTAASVDVKLTPVLDWTVDPLTLDLYADLGALPGSTLAWQTLARDRCDVSLKGRYDSLVNWTMRLAVATGTHEVGHGLGHNHVRDRNALMFPSITGEAQRRRGFPNATDLTQHRRLGYRVPANPLAPLGDTLWEPREDLPDEPDPPSPPTPPQPPEEPPMNPLEKFFNKFLERLFGSDLFDDLIDRLLESFFDHLLSGMDEVSARQAAVAQVMKDMASILSRR